MTDDRMALVELLQKSGDGMNGVFRVELNPCPLPQRTAGIGSAGRPAKSRWCESITMKE
jgi:hypothetical protein